MTVPLTRAPASAAEQPRARLVVVVARGRGEVVELLSAQFDAVRGGVLLDTGDPLGAGDRGDVVALGQQPSEGDLSGGGAGLVGDGLDLVGQAQVAPEVLTVKRGLFLRQSSSPKSSVERI